jgi:hypothetical protein
VHNRSIATACDKESTNQCLRRAGWDNARQSLLRIAESEGYNLFRCSKPATPLYLLSGLLDNIAEQTLIEQGSKRQFSHFAGDIVVSVEHLEAELFSAIINLGSAIQRLKGRFDLGLDSGDSFKCQHSVKLHLVHLSSA